MNEQEVRDYYTEALFHAHEKASAERDEARAENQRLREESRLTTAELHAAGDHLVRLDDEVTRLRAECDALRHEVCQRIAERAGETFRKRALHDHYVTLRDGIEKLRDDYTNGWVDVDGYPHSPQPAVARRLTEMLEGDFQEQLDRARVKYRGALDELRDK